LKIYTKQGDDGSTGLFYGGRVRKDHAAPEAYGAVDEAVAAIGVARAAADEVLGTKLLQAQRDLFVLSAELATHPQNRAKLTPGVSLVEAGMVDRLELEIDSVVADIGTPTEFVVPGDNEVAAAIDLARAVVRRAERRTVTLAASAGITDSLAPAYLNRLADYLYILTRAVESEWVPSRIKEE
jgi:cob(I)alamin adenosyltransferase